MTANLPAIWVQAAGRRTARVSELWQETGLVFCTTIGAALDAANVRRGFGRG
ncbi:MAG: hypothetical protein ACRDS1_12245 [Pseudonocardiaceae bacterium]